MEEVNQLSLREKIGQTVVMLSNPAAELERCGSLDRFLATYPVGGMFVGAEIIAEVMSGSTKEQVREVTAAYAAHTRLPLLFASDMENGCGSMVKGMTKLPHLMALGAGGDRELAYRFGRATALEARSLGVNWSFSPVVDLNQNRWNPITNIRSVSDDPRLAIPLLKGVVQGMQEQGLGATAKHFPGDGNDWRDQHLVTTHNPLSMSEWTANHGAVFQSLIDAGVYAIMTGHITLPAYQQARLKGQYPPATLSEELTTGLLKREMGFQGVVVSDALIMGGFIKWYGRGQADIECFKAGTDMLLWPDLSYFERMEQAIVSGEVPMERLDDAVSRILSMKRKLGLLDGIVGLELHRPLTEPEVLEVRDTACKIAESSVTLLRDRSGLLPLNPAAVRKILIVGISPNDEDISELQGLTETFGKYDIQADFKRNLWYEELEQIEVHYDLIVYALHLRPHRPIGPLQAAGAEASAIWSALSSGASKSVVISFGSPYMLIDYFELADIYINVYSHVPASLQAVVDALFGIIPFAGVSPVKLETPEYVSIISSAQGVNNE